MKTKPIRSLKCSLALLAALAALTSATHAQNATWSGGAGNTDWNNALNWDIGVPAEGTNAVVGAGFTVDYNAPMAAGSFGTLTANSPLNINAGGFVVGGSGNTAATLTGSATALLSVNSGGVLSVTNGGVTASASGGVLVAPGGSLSASGLLSLGASGNVGFFTNSGGDLSVVGLRVNANNASSSARALILGGSNYLGNVTIFRSGSGSASFQALGAEGLIISNGLVNLASLAVGAQGANSTLTMQVAGGTVTNTGTFIVGQVSGANSRPARYVQQGGVVVSTIADGIRVGVSNSTQITQYIVTGGTNLAERFLLGDGTNGVTGVTVNFTNAAKIYIGSGGIVSNNVNTLNVALNNGGTFGANAAWSGGVSIILAGGAFDCADLGGTAQDITLNGVLRGSGALNKSGAGKLTLNAANTFTGPTTVNQGTLALAATGSISNCAQITVAGGATLDFQAVASPALLGSQTLLGNGTVAGSLTALSGSTLRPGGLSAAGTLTFSGGLAESGGVNNSLELSTDPNNSAANDRINIVGDLNLTGVNNILVSPLAGPLPAETAYPLIQYSGNFNGTLANLALFGSSGTLSNDASGKVIYLVTGAAVRAPTSIVWLGGLAGNAWDTQSTSNWLNGVARDFFVTGDSVRFDDVGATNSLVTVLGSVSPAALVVDTASNYVWTGSGSIDGSTSLVKTNAGTLSVLNTNGYAGATIVGGGALEAVRLANGGVNSSLGAATSDATNLQFFDATLRYLGTTTATDRGATLNGAANVIDVASNATVLTLNGSLAGTSALIKNGSGSLVLGAANTYTNGTVINGGVLQANVAGALTGAAVTNNGATLRVAIGGTVTLGNVLSFDGDCVVDLNNAAGDTHLDGAWSGGGTVAIINQQNSSRTFTVGGNGSGGGNTLNFSGAINMTTNTGSLRFNDGGGNANLGSTNMTIDLGSGSATFLVRNGGVTIDVGALVGGPNTRVTGRGSGSSGVVTYSVGGKNLSTTFAGTITNSTSGNATAITKVGSGTWTLSGVSTYTGFTIISNGVLALSGSGLLSNTSLIDITAGSGLSSSARTDGALPLGAGQVLTGEGVVHGSVTATNAAIVSPGENTAASPAGAGTLGVLTITNALVLGDGSTLVIDLDASNGTNDVVTGLASMTYGGTLELSYFSTTFTTGARFKLFHANSYAGAFANINPPTPGPNQSWDTGRLTVDGTLGVSVAHPGFSVVNRLGSDLVMSGTNGIPFGSYYMLASTNVALPLVNWTPLATNTFEFDGSFSFTNAVDVHGPPQFFLLQVPQ